MDEKDPMELQRDDTADTDQHMNRVRVKIASAPGELIPDPHSIGHAIYQEMVRTVQMPGKDGRMNRYPPWVVGIMTKYNLEQYLQRLSDEDWNFNHWDQMSAEDLAAVGVTAGGTCFRWREMLKELNEPADAKKSSDIAMRISAAQDDMINSAAQDDNEPAVETPVAFRAKFKNLQESHVTVGATIEVTSGKWQGQTGVTEKCIEKTIKNSKCGLPEKNVTQIMWGCKLQSGKKVKLNQEDIKVVLTEDDDESTDS